MRLSGSLVATTTRKDELSDYTMNVENKQLEEYVDITTSNCRGGEFHLNTNDFLALAAFIEKNKKDITSVSMHCQQHIERCRFETKRLYMHCDNNICYTKILGKSRFFIWTPFTTYPVFMRFRSKNTYLQIQRQLEEDGIMIRRDDKSYHICDDSEIYTEPNTIFRQ